MLKIISRFFLAALLIAASDIALLYLIYDSWGLSAFIVLVLIPPLIGGNLVRFAQQRLTQNAETTPQISDGVLLLIAQFLFVFPGPISTVVALLLLLPSVRRMLGFLARNQLQKAVARGTVTVVSGFNTAGIREQRGGNLDHLERAEGRVVDDGELEPPKQLESN